MWCEIEDKPDSLSFKNFDAMVVYAYDFLSIPDEIDLEVIFERIDGPTTGFCDYEDGLAQISISDTLDIEMIIRTFFHEMVHVGQIYDGRLVMGENLNPSRWNGVECTMAYFDTPWELDAFQKENEMFSAFMGCVYEKDSIG
jgi:hypothetical protein